MSDRDRGIPADDAVDTASNGEPGRAGAAPGTGSLGAPPTDAPEADNANSSTGAAGTRESDLGGVDIGGAGNPGAGLGATRGVGFGTGA
jgi:hypothetical protein